VAGLVVDVAAPPVAVMPVSEGMEKNVLAHAAGDVADMRASLVSVTTSGLLAAPLAPTVNGAVRVWELPLVAVAKFQVTPLVEVLHPVCAVVSAFVVRRSCAAKTRWSAGGNPFSPAALTSCSEGYRTGADADHNGAEVTVVAALVVLLVDLLEPHAPKTTAAMPSAARH